MPKSRLTKFQYGEFAKDRISIVETNVDDVTGEVIAHAIDRVLTEGAYDATAIHYTGKKDRPGFTLRVTCATKSTRKFARLLVEETGTLGVKTTEYERLIVPRKVQSVLIQIKQFRDKINVKVARIGNFERIKPEFGDAKRIAQITGTPLRRVLELISEQAQKQIHSER